MAAGCIPSFYRTASLFCSKISFHRSLLIVFPFVQRFTPLTQLIAISIAAHIALGGSRVTTSLYALSLQATEFTVGTLIALFAIFPMLFAVTMGRLIDRIGIKRPMLCGSLALCIGCVIPSLFAGLPVLYLSVILIGTGFMGIHIGSQHAVGAMSSSETRSANFSWLALGFSISSFLGPVIAGFVIDHARFASAYGVCGGFAMLALVIAACGNLDRIKPQHTDAGLAGGSVLDLLRHPEMRRVYTVGILLAAAWDLFTFVTPILGTRLGFSASTIGLILGSFSAASFAVRLLMPYLVRRYTEWQVLTAAMIIVVVCYALYPFMHHAVSLMAIAAGLGFALGSAQPNVLSLLHHSAPAGRGGEAIGIRATIGNASQVILPLAFGAAGATMGLFAVFWGLGAIVGAGVPMAWRKAARQRRGDL
jgi:predicted MFS family arabinose efflux permease